MKKLFELIKSLFEKNFYGRLVITFREGEIVSCVKEENLNIDGLRN